ncbi:esterase E4-like isoform X2 [Microplitis mediator]|uniref:esterase E4-like isoform X2 n=1 Tax=Microplitis mediator TaxID=375433 RepID=UPI002555367B|nr:esterase E4-like isoform X2 [Microplitis mediator]
MENPIVQVQQGKLRGIKERNYNGNNYYAFRGIPYAKPPIGKLRFKDPEPAVSWSGIRSATKYGNKCAQINWFTQKIDGSDDCLYLNVFTMELNPSEAKAVMFFIHPGNFSFGSGSDELYGPDFIVEKDVVLVTINYRVGILGFLNLDDESASGNQGLKDQVIALKWVQQNIDKFGGDPNSVTIFGSSAGGSSVHYLSLSPLTQGLFHKVILQSGVATNPWATVPHSMKEKAIEISSILGNKITDSKELVDYLQKTDVQLLLKAAASLLSWENKYLSLNTFGPSVDHKSKTPFLSIPIEDAVKSGIKIPCIIGMASHEAIITLAGLNEDNLSEIAANQDTLLLHPNVKCFLQRHNISIL